MCCKYVACILENTSIVYWGIHHKAPYIYIRILYINAVHYNINIFKTTLNIEF